MIPKNRQRVMGALLETAEQFGMVLIRHRFRFDWDEFSFFDRERNWHATVTISWCELQRNPTADELAGLICHKIIGAREGMGRHAAA